jgi:hypothetical protein
MSTSKTVLLRSYLPQTEDFFQYKNEMIYKLVEEFDQDTAERFQSLYQEEAPDEQQEYFEFEEEDGEE